MKQVKLTVMVPKEIHEKIKFLALLYDMKMREIIIDAISTYAEIPSEKDEIKKLRHQMYRIKYDSYEDE